MSNTDFFCHLPPATWDWKLQTANCKLETANWELQTANWKLVGITASMHLYDLTTSMVRHTWHGSST